MRKIKRVTLHEGGTTFHYVIGNKLNAADSILKIDEHQPVGPGDRWYYDVHFGNGNMVRLFDISEVHFEKDE